MRYNSLNKGYKEKMMDSTEQSLLKFNLSTPKFEVPLAMLDAQGTTILSYGATSLLDEEERMLFCLEELGSFLPENAEELLKKFADKTNEASLIAAARKNLRKKNPKMTEIRFYYALGDILLEEYYKNKLNDPNQEKRIEILSKVYYFAHPDIFSYAVDYAKEKYNREIDVALVTQASPIMARVYPKMLEGQKVQLITVPDPRFRGLSKDDAQLYNLIAQQVNKPTENLGLLDDTLKYIQAAQKAGAKALLFEADDAANDQRFMYKKIEAGTKKIINMLFDDKNNSLSK